MHGIDYVEVGSSPTVLFVPGSYRTHAAWRPIQKVRVRRYRIAGISHCGYGTTLATRTRDDFDMRHETRIVE
ncbi:hypothetical protein [Neoaquamicrobium sediminum]|uniref:hypothetical protein n=1 Tax=Neoaquamicrobium sediminum TaxID=1849104 RepID=UPI003621FB8A